MERVSAIARHVVPSETSQLQGAPQRPHELIVDAWAQHPTARFLDEPFLESLRRWTRSLSSGATGLSQSLEAGDPPLELTVDSMDAGGVRHTLLNAWAPPKRAPLISNDEVAACVVRYPQRFSGIGSVDFSRPMDAIREIRRCAHDLKFVGIRILPWLCEVRSIECRAHLDRRSHIARTAVVVPAGSSDRQAILSNLRDMLRARAATMHTDRPHGSADAVRGRAPDLSRRDRTSLPGPDDRRRPHWRSLDQRYARQRRPGHSSHATCPDGTSISHPTLVVWIEAIAVATKHQNVYIDTSAYSVRRYPNSLVCVDARRDRLDPAICTRRMTSWYS